MSVEKKMLERMRVHGDIRSVGLFITDDGENFLRDLTEQELQNLLTQT